MTARAFARGHFDARSRLYRIVLFAQKPPQYQGVLFTTAAPEPAAAPSCTHPELGVQADLFGGPDVLSCTFCHVPVPESTC